MSEYERVNCLGSRQRMVKRTLLYYGSKTKYRFYERNIIEENSRILFWKSGAADFLPCLLRDITNESAPREWRSARFLLGRVNEPGGTTATCRSGPAFPSNLGRHDVKYIVGTVSHSRLLALGLSLMRQAKCDTKHQQRGRSLIQKSE